MRQVGIDIGATAIRVVETDGLDRDGYARVSRIAIAPLPRTAVRNGIIAEPITVAQVLSRALRKGNLSGYGVVLGVANTQTVLGRTIMPSSVKREERVGVVRNGRQWISPQIRKDQSAISVSWAGDGFTEDSRAVTHLSTAAALHTMVASVEEVCEYARVSPRALDLSAAAAMRALVRDLEGSAVVHTVVDIGESKTTITTREGLDLRSMRVITTAGWAITEKIREAAQVDPREAERIKASLRLGATTRDPRLSEVTVGYGTDRVTVPTRDYASETLVEEALFESTEILVTAIAQNIDQDASAFPVPTQGVTLIGGGSELQGLPERLEQATGVPCVLGAPWAIVEKSRGTEAFLDERGEVDPALLRSLTTAIGLSLWSEDPR